MEVYVTGHSHNANGTLHYIYFGTYKTGHGKLNQAHANPNGVKNRNVLLFGVNCRRGYHQAVNDFNRYLKQKPNNKVQTLNVVLSFPKSEFNFNDKEDCYKASELGKKFMSKAFPNHQGIIALQHDNKNAIPHVHLIVNAISMKAPYYTIPAKAYGIGRLRAIGADCIKSYDKQFDTKISGITKHKGNGYQKPNEDQKRVIKALDSELNLWQVNTHSKLRNALKQDGIRASFKRRGGRRKRKRKRRGRRRYKRNGLVFKFITHDKSGKKHNHYVTASSLGRVQDSEATFTSPKDYTLAGIDKKLDENKERAKQARANQRKAEKEAHDKHVQAVRQRQLQRQRQHEQQLEIIKIERKKKNDKRKLLQRQRSQRINQIQSSVKESAIQCHDFDNVITRPQPEASQSDKRLSDELQHVKSQTWRTGKLGTVVTRIRNKFKQAYRRVRSGFDKVYSFFSKKRKKQRQQKTQSQRQKIAPDYNHQHWFTDENGALERSGSHLELYIQQAMAFRSKRTNIPVVSVRVRYRRDASKYFGGQDVCATPFRNKSLPFQAMPLKQFNKILSFSGQPSVPKVSLSYQPRPIINGSNGIRRPAPFKSNVYKYKNERGFNCTKVTPSPKPFSYINELRLNKEWHWNHDFNMSHNRYWNWYSNMYKRDRGVRPNPRDTKLLHNFQFQIEYAIRIGQKKRNEPLTPCNQIERGINESVNADTDNADNYTKPWYVNGTDIQPSDGGRGFE